MVRKIATDAKQVSRHEFLKQGSSVIFAISAFGCLQACMTKIDSDDASGQAFKGPYTLSVSEKATLDTNGFINLSGVIAVKDGATYRAYGRICPHESGAIVGQSATSLQCQRHTEQFFNNFGQGNGARTSASLTQYTVTDNAGTLTIT